MDRPHFLRRSDFTLLAEIEPATKADLQGVREQIAVLAPVAHAFLVPDNHLGRPTVSSLAVAHEVAKMGGRSVACLNARDRNLLGLRRDLLTAAAYGVDHLLLVQGDQVEGTAPVLTTHAMFDEARESAERLGLPGLRLGVTARVGAAVPMWKRSADFLLAQISFSVTALGAWRTSISFDGPVLSGVMVLPSATTARRLAGNNLGIDIPAPVIERLEEQPSSGVDIATDLIDQIRASRAVDGVHLISGRRFREVAMGLLAKGR